MSLNILPIFYILDINECVENSFICPNGNCQNFMGGYQCACYTGFESSDDMKSCIGKPKTRRGECYKKQGSK
jgi:hypothetical protein